MVPTVDSKLVSYRALEKVNTLLFSHFGAFVFSFGKAPSSLDHPSYYSPMYTTSTMNVTAYIFYHIKLSEYLCVHTIYGIV